MVSYFFFWQIIIEIINYFSLVNYFMLKTRTKLIIIKKYKIMHFTAKKEKEKS